jgi:threonine synthase
MGASVAAYSGIANLNCVIFTPTDTAKVKMEQILAYGVRIYHVSGDYATAAKMVEVACKKFGFYLLGDYLWRREGTKSVAFEIADQMLQSQGAGPDCIVCPIGNGTLISACWKALRELHHLGLVRKLPRMIGVQAGTCSPVCTAFRKNREIAPLCGRTIAVAIECGDPLDGKRALMAMEESGGFCETVTDKQILRARELLAEEEGLFAEPAGAVALAGLLKARKKIRKGSRVACLVTGHGLKTPRTGVRGKPKEIAGKLSVLDKLFKPTSK